MTIFLDENESRNPANEQNWARGRRTSFVENAKAAWNFMSKTYNVQYIIVRSYGYLR